MNFTSSVAQSPLLGPRGTTGWHLPVANPAKRLAFVSPLRKIQKYSTCIYSIKAEGEPEEDNFEGLDPEDDQEIPGNYRDAMTSNTPLGKAIKDACNELDTLATLEKETLLEADALLKKLGVKTSLFDVPQQHKEEQQP